MSFLDDAQGALRDISARVGASVVGVGHRRGIGSGVVVAPGRVLTNAHNLRGDAVEVTFHDGRTGTGTPAGADVDGDVAVLEVGTDGATAIDWPAPSGAEIGSPVFALANPGGRGLRVTLGFVSGTERSFRGPRGRRITGSIEHTSPLLPGSSGGPIVDPRGGFLGLNTNRLGEGFYLAIPADEELRQRVSELAEGRDATRPRLGIGVAPAEVARGLRRAVGLPEADGLLVRMVEEGGPAAAAGLAEGDLIVAVQGRAVSDVDDLQEVLEGLEKDSSIEVRLLRGIDERTVSLGLDPGNGNR